MSEANSPILQLSTSGNLGKIRAILETKNRQSLIIGGDGRVVRELDASNLMEIRSLRGQTGKDGYGAITSMALSPDNRWLAVGIFYPHDTNLGEVRCYLRIYDYKKGQLLRLLYGHKQVIHSLSFSPDGSMLISGEALQDNPVAIIWNTVDWTQKHALYGHQNQIFGAGFTPDNRKVITTGWDQTIKFWDVSSGELLKSLKAHDSRIYSMAISSSNKEPFVVTGSIDKKVKIWDAQSFKLIKTIKIGRRIQKIALSPDNLNLAVAAVGINSDAVIETFNINTGKRLASFNAYDLTPSALLISSDNQTVYSAGGNTHQLHSWDIFTGKQSALREGVGSPVYSAGISDDGNTIYWGTKKKNRNGRRNFTHQIELVNLHGHLGQPTIARNVQGSKISAGHKLQKFSLRTTKSNSSGFKDDTLIIKKGSQNLGSVKRVIKTGHYHTAYTITPDAKHFISGGLVGHLELYDISGKEIGRFQGHTGEITDLSISKDGALLVSVSRDQTIRLWNILSQELLISIFLTRDDEWVVWTSSGHYAASPNGDQYIGWVVNHGIEGDAKYVLADALKQKLYRPDVIDKIIQTRSPSQALASSAHTDFTIDQLDELVLPNFSILDTDYQSAPEINDIDVIVENDQAISDETIWSVSVNGRQTYKQASIASSTKQKLPVELDPGENSIAIKATNRSGEVSRNLIISRQKAKQTDRVGKLLMISVGINKYKNLPKNKTLSYAVADASELSIIMAKQAGKLFSSIETIVLTDNGIQPPTKANIEDALDRISSLTNIDTVLLFLAGHGVLQGRDYFFLPQEAEYNSQGRLKSSSVLSWKSIQDALENSLGRRIMLVDTCHSEGAFNPRLLKDAEDSNIIVMSSTDVSTLALELPTLKHGVFTFSVLEGLEGMADSFKDDKITMSELNAHVANSVAEKTQHRQIPVLTVPGGFQDFIFSLL